MPHSDESIRRGTLIASRYRILRKLGEGGFGTVYTATDSQGRSYAVKYEKRWGGDDLWYEKYVYERINHANGKSGYGIPRMYYYGRIHGHGVMVLELLGKSIEKRLEEGGGRLSLKSCYMLGIQLISRLEYIHECGFVHGDIKPDNILTGRKYEKRVYLADFGLAKKFRRSNGKHVGYVSEGMGGTVTYSSRNVMRGIRCTRRDDLESLGYVLLECFLGRLPWDRIRGNGRKGRVLEMKEELNLRGAFRGLKSYFGYVRGLGFADRPSYRTLKKFFVGGMESEFIVDDGRFDWIVG